VVVVQQLLAKHLQGIADIAGPGEDLADDQV